jgi:hypothetical protein
MPRKSFKYLEEKDIELSVCHHIRSSQLTSQEIKLVPITEGQHAKNLYADGSDALKMAQKMRFPSGEHIDYILVYVTPEFVGRLLPPLSDHHRALPSMMLFSSSQRIRRTKKVMI